LESPIPYSEVAASYNGRIAAIKRLHAVGVVEMHWEDEDGGHSQQGDMNLWLELPRKTALQVSKLGERLLWLGSDDEHYWLFDLSQKPTRFSIARHDAPVAQAYPVDAAGRQSPVVQPLLFLDLLGLTPLPATKDATVFLGADPKTNSIVVEADSGDVAQVDGIAAVGPHGRRRLYLDPSTLLPERIELRDPNGTLVGWSELSRYIRADIPGLSVLSQPRVPGLADIYDASGTGYIKVAIDRVDEGEDKAFNRVFDLDQLRKAMPIRD